jgi:uncharacterized membrane protein YeaQ/YmgE (transglycosylase-associated protein family)
MLGAIILGILAGFIGRLLMPGKDKMGFIATVALGLAGAAVGWVVFYYVLGIGDKDAFDLGSLAGAVVGVMILLGLVRLYRHHESNQHFWHRHSGHSFEP